MVAISRALNLSIGFSILEMYEPATVEVRDAHHADEREIYCGLAS
jgi:hypothetical protein